MGMYGGQFAVRRVSFSCSLVWVGPRGFGKGRLVVVAFCRVSDLLSFVYVRY